MSITHSLMIMTEMTSPQIRELLLNSKLGLKPDGDEDMQGEAVRAYSGNISGLRQEVVREDYGVRANLCVYFRMNSREDEDEGYRIIGRAIAAFLKQETGDAVFLIVGEVPALQRIDGRVVIADENDEYSEWLTPPLDAAGIRYEQQHAMTPAA